MSAATLEVDGVSARLSGDLTFATVTALFNRMEAVARSGNMPASIDLAGVEQIDSAGLALLLEWQSDFRKRQGNPSGSLIRIVNPPEALLKIARLCDAEDFLSDGDPGPGRGGAQ